MPIYEFKCKKCGAVSEVLFRSSIQTQKPACGKCGSKNVHRLLSVFAMSGGEKRPSSGGGASCGSCRRSSCAGCR